MADQNEMDSFIRNYFSGITRVREASAQPSDAVVRQTTTFIPDTPNPIAAEPSTSGASFLGGGSKQPFEATRNPETGAINVNGGSYQIANTTTDKPAVTVSGNYVYAQIKNTGGTFDSFDIIGSVSTLPVTVGGNETVAQVTHNVLLAEVITTGSPPVSTIVQRRAGNFTLVNGVVNGKVALIPFGFGGNINPNV